MLPQMETERTPGRDLPVRRALTRPTEFVWDQTLQLTPGDLCCRRVWAAWSQPSSLEKRSRGPVRGPPVRDDEQAPSGNTEAPGPSGLGGWWVCVHL